MKPIKLIRKKKTWNSNTWENGNLFPAFSVGDQYIIFDLSRCMQSGTNSTTYKKHIQKELAKWILKQLNRRIKQKLPFTREYLDAMIKVIRETDNAFEDL